MGLRRHHGRSEHGRVNYLASVSDLMSALLFVFILTLAVAIIQARSAAEDAKSQTARALNAQERLEAVQKRLSIVENRLAGNQAALQGLLSGLQEELRRAGLPVDIDPARGVLRLPESAVTFPVGSALLDPDNIERVNLVGAALAQTLPCYQAENLELEACTLQNPNGHTLEAVFIEGHTDNQAYRDDKTGRRNRILSTARSNAVYDAMVSGNDRLETLRNVSGERLFSLSGYGSERPLEGHDWELPTDDPANRRIEFRFIMTPPAISEEESRLIEAEPVKEAAP